MLYILLCFLMRAAWCDLVLPPHMKLGAGISAFQSEGAWNVDGKSPSILDTYFQSDLSPYKPGEACKSYELYKEDVEMAKTLGLQFYRFSIAWTRILPDGFSHNVNEAGVNYYNNLINELIYNGIEPVATIMHYDLPQCLQDLGGWLNPDFQDWFADYARTVFLFFGDRVKTWITINEPIYTCYRLGIHLEIPYNYNEAAKNMLLAHAKAWRVYDEEFRIYQNGMVSIANLMNWMIPASEEDEDLAELARQYYMGIYSHAIYSSEGGWPCDLKKALAENENATSLPEFTDEEIEIMKGTYDFFALNYYQSALVRKAKPGEDCGTWPTTGSPELGFVLEQSPDWQRSTDGTIVTPEGIRSTLLWLNKQYGVKKFFIAENGLSSKGEMDDYDRYNFILKHLEELSLAESDGLQIIGYTAWAIMDNYQFQYGYTPKYGLYSVNFTDPMRARTPRASAHLYKSLIGTLPMDFPSFTTSIN